MSTVKIFLMPFGKVGIHSVLFLHAPISHGKKMQNRLIQGNTVLVLYLSNIKGLAVRKHSLISMSSLPALPALNSLE